MEKTKEISEEAMIHLREHIEKWPATKEEIIETCNKMQDIDGKEKKMFEDKLPDGVYDTPDDVINAMDKAMM